MTFYPIETLHLSLHLIPAISSPFLRCVSHRYGHDAKVVHFLGKVKPWNYSYDTQKGEVVGHGLSSDSSHLHPDFLLTWWQLYAKSVAPLLQRAYGDAPFNSGFTEAREDVCCRLWRVCERKGIPECVSICCCMNSSSPREYLEALFSSTFLSIHVVPKSSVSSPLVTPVVSIAP